MNISLTLVEILYCSITFCMSDQTGICTGQHQKCSENVKLLKLMLYNTETEQLMK